MHIKVIRKITGTVFIAAGLVMAVRTIFKGIIDWYPAQNYIHETPLQESVNILSTLLLIGVPIIIGIFVLIRNKKRRSR